MLPEMESDDRRPLPTAIANAPMAPLTTFELGGPARWLVDADREEAIFETLAAAAREEAAVTFIGGGSNVVIADRGLDGYVVRMALRGVRLERQDDRVALWAAAGEPWDALVERSVAEGLAGIECLSGIPGTAGATPIQNVGAYGQDVSEAIDRVRVFDRRSEDLCELTRSECAFGYRTSRFRREPDRYIVLAVRFLLRPGGTASIRYPELARALGSAAAPSLTDVRRAILELRRSKSMVLDRNDPNHRSAGSFFTNPVISPADADRVADRAVSIGAAEDVNEVPRFPAPDGDVKLAAAWLIERSGFPKGFRSGAFGISTRHSLAIVHHGGGTSGELARFASAIRAAVFARFEVMLVPEPIFLGFGPGDPLPPV